MMIEKKNNQIAMQQIQRIVIPGGPPTAFVVIPEYITVHLGAPDEEAENVTVPFIDYIKNVASSELYPTWPENALRANIHAIVSVALNRIVLEWYPSRGYNFDITNSTRYDQAFVYNRGIYDNISVIVDEIFNQYIIRNGQVIPLYATFCDGRAVQCDGLHQWGTVDLANQGYTPMEILQYYYGDDISLVVNAPVGGIGLSYPGEPLIPGDSSIIILRQQLGLNRIAMNFPAIPVIEPVDGYYGPSTVAAVMAFQRIFNLPVTGIIDEATFYRIRQIYVAVEKLGELTVEGSIYEQIINLTRGLLLKGDIRPAVSVIQYFLDVLSLFYPTIPTVAYTCIFDNQTQRAVVEFQKLMGLEPTGALDSEAILLLYNTVLGIFETIPTENVYIPALRFPGAELSLGDRKPGVFIIQEMLQYISLTIPTIPPLNSAGTFDEETDRAVRAFQSLFGLEVTGIVNEATWNEITRVYREQRFGGLNPVSLPPNL